MKRLLVICGPTATGKTALGINLAKKLNGEVVSADSRQVYKGMDIGTGKDVGNIKYQISNIKSDLFDLGFYPINDTRIWLLDIVEPDYQFSVADYVECASSVIEDIRKRDKLPILVGGTGLYIKGIIDGIDTLGIVPDRKLRKRLENLSTHDLREELAEADPQKLQSMNESDRNNPRRLIRAIEISKSPNNKAPLRSSGQANSNNFSNFDILMIGLTSPYNILYQRIDNRVDQRVKQGIENEIGNLLKNGFSWDNSVLGNTIAYREWESYFEDRKPKEEILKEWKFAEHGLARRQMTWFKRDNRINWFDISRGNWQPELENLTQRWYHQS